MKKIAVIIIIAMLIIITVSSPIFASSQPIRVAVSLGVFVPVVKDIGGAYVEVSSIVPPGVEPHEFSLSPGVIDNVSLADLIIIDGHIEWENELLNVISQRKNKPINSFSLNLINYSSNMTILNMPNGSEISGKNYHGYWLLPDNMKIIARLIYGRLVSIDPVHSDYYKSNLQIFFDRISFLENRLSNVRKLLNGKPVVLGFLEEDYIAYAMGLKVVAVLSAGESPTANPNALSLAYNVLKNEKGIIMVSDIASEMPLYNSVTQLSKQTGAPLVIVITTINEDYVSAMMYNIGKVEGVISMKSDMSTSQVQAGVDPMLIFSIGLVGVIIMESLYIFRLRRLLK
ncbi:MAG: metal ABC transporter substrate-binding protein [Thermoprotei archaeon]